MSQTGRSTMVEFARRILTAVDGATGALVPGPFVGSDLQLALTLPNGTSLSVWPDADVPALYELVHLDSLTLLGDKLSADQVLEFVREAGKVVVDEAAQG